jgi:hypothetical protein
VHICLHLKLFGKQQRVDFLLDAQRNNDVTRHSEQVKKNRLILCQFIDAVCYLANQELLLWGYDKSFTSLNKGNFMEFLSVLKNYDPLLENHLNSVTVFWGTSANIQNDLIEAGSTVIKEEIKKEVQTAKFISIMLDETSDIQCKSQLCTVLHYLSDSKICEQFLGFTNVSSDRTSDGLFKHIQQVNCTCSKYNTHLWQWRRNMLIAGWCYYKHD